MSNKIVPGLPGSKTAKQARNGVCGLRGGVGLAGRLALEGKLGKEHKKREAARKIFPERF